MFRKKESAIIHATGSLAQYEFDGDDFDRYYLAMRAVIRLLSDLQSGKDAYAVVPGRVLDTSIDFLEGIYKPDNFHEGRIFRTDDSEYLLWQNLVSQHMPELVDWINDQNISMNRIGLFPYASAPDYWNVFNHLREKNIDVFSNMDKIGDREIMNPSHFVHKGAYYRWMNRPETAENEKRFKFLDKPEGLIAEDNEQLIRALLAMQTKLGGDKAVVLKQIFAGGGYGITFFNSITEVKNAVFTGKYNFDEHPYDEESLHPVLMQEAVNIIEDEHGEVGISVQFNGQEIVGVTRTLSDGKGHWTGNVIIDSKNPPNPLKRKHISDVIRTSQRLLKTIKPEGRGGIDLLLVDDGKDRKVTFIEINGARTTGAEEAVKFDQSIDKRNKGVVGLYKYTIDKNIGLSIEAVYEILKREGIAFTMESNGQAQYGVLPIICIGDHLTVTGYGRNSKELLGLFRKLEIKIS